MNKLIAIAIPILPGKEDEWKSFIGELNGKRKNDFQNSRKELGVRERTFYQQTPTGSLVIVTLEGENPEKAFEKFAQRNDEFSRWFLDKVKKVHDLDLSQPPQGPMPELIADTGSVEAVSA